MGSDFESDFKKDLELVIVTGMSGAGKTEAVRSLEDIGFFVLTTFHRI